MEDLVLGEISQKHKEKQYRTLYVESKKVEYIEAE